MFESFPLLHGEYMRYHEYLALLIATTSLLTAAMVLGLHAALLVALRRGWLPRSPAGGGARARVAGAGGGDGGLLSLELTPVSSEASVEEGHKELADAATAVTTPSSTAAAAAAHVDPARRQRREAWVVSLLGLGTVFILWFVWTLEGFGTMGWTFFVLAILAVLLVLGGWPSLVARCRGGGGGARTAAS
jgi:hypothetical protein